jgi:hypothetical protein
MSTIKETKSKNVSEHLTLLGSIDTKQENTNTGVETNGITENTSEESLDGALNSINESIKIFKDIIG